jgi:transcriptional antiterminator RfaH
MVRLERQGFPAYLPRYLKRHRRARRIEMVRAPLFPRYLFVAIDLTAQRWRSIFSTVGVSRIVCNGKVLTPISHEVISSSGVREGAGGFVRVDRSPKFRADEKIRVVDGTFAHCLGLYEGMKDRDRIAILLDLLGRKVRGTVDGQNVAAA